MRCDQHMGLPGEALAFLSEAITLQTCPCCNRLLPKKQTKIGACYGMFDTEYPLYRYKLDKGGYADEFLQASPWSSGPCLFLGLNVYDDHNKLIKTFEWDDESLEQC